MNIKPKVRPTIVGRDWSTRFNLIIDREFSHLRRVEVVTFFKRLGEIEGNFNVLGRIACSGHGVLTIGYDYTDFDGEIEYYKILDATELYCICTNIAALSSECAQIFSAPFLMRFTFSQIARLQ